ncbi:tRNA glutamyl-Q(34) synthetase GluQRS [Alicyclobacillus acidocaldarius]|uniref:Glutamyl-Q tRNA(Asp) synthetase n=1 Tax=Alicyclobacillus acidocaldarius (strain Tc-4-1) TaxID=1048834 RepID=F8IF45_ALIAT|nr:tRNA glutamyl-Q(34) synthetase GluQRS [Alicyclobacillus acidocaldarius]AEJ42828.1 Glutamate--tRNA ligase [Alicyclobacillus acidocaldarius subsp. acidocaldarius Tc-4-1]
MTPSYKGRFAPSPTGYLHVGNAWVAILAWLDARQKGGAFILRVEDLDEARSRDVYRGAMMEDLRWLGVDWDEGPDVGGPAAPYEQRFRRGLYEQALARLQEARELYPCFCARSRLLSIASAPQGQGLFSDEPRYDGRCLRLSDAERAERAASKPPSFRLHVSDEALVTVDDRLLGRTTARPAEGGDFVVRRADGVIAYHLAVVVDDHAMGVTDVIRGADLFPSAFRQVYLAERLGYAPPRYAHVPLVVDEEGRRLAKRHGDLSLRALRQAGVRSEHLVGFLLWLAGQLDRPEPVRLAEVMDRFDLARLPRHPVVWRAAYTRWLQAHADA